MTHDSWMTGSFDADVAGFLALLAVWATSLLGVAWLVAGSLRRGSAAVRYCVWQFGLSGLLALPVLFALLPGIPLGFALPSRSPASTPSAGDPTSSSLSAFPSGRELDREGRASDGRFSNAAGSSRPPLGVTEDPEADRTIAATHVPLTAPRMAQGPQAVQPSAGPATPIRFSWSLLLVGAWAFGLVVHFTWFAIAALRVRRLLRGANPLRHALFEQVLSERERRLVVRRRVGLLMSAKTPVPVVVGVRRPRVLLPADCAHWSPHKIRMVLSHELAHVERRDVLWQLVARTAAAVYWFHPLVWLAVRRLREERECACDDRVLMAGVQPVDYASGLVEVAAALRGQRALRIGGIGMAERCELEDRVRWILGASSSRGPASARVKRGLLVATTCAVLALSVVRPFSPLLGGAAEPPDAEKPKATSLQPPAEATSAKPTTAKLPDEASTTGAMRIRVLGPDDELMPGARIHVSVWTKEPFKNNQDYVGDANGQVDVDLPETLTILRIWARREGYVPLFAQWWAGKQPDGHQVPEDFTYHLQEGTLMGGVVKNEDGEPIEGAKVEVMYERATDKDELSERPVFDSWLAEGDTARTTDAQGRWTLDNVPPGDDVDVRIKLSHPDYIDDQSWGEMQKKQNVKAADLREQTATIVMRRGISVTGTVTDPEGNPVKDAVVVWGDSPYWQTGSQEVRTNEEGTYRFPPLPTGPMTVTVVAQGWMPELRKIDISLGNLPVDFQLQPGKTLRVRFVDRSGDPVPNVDVQIARWRGGESLYNHKHPNVLDTNVPRQADEKGVYQWTWAPDDPVSYLLRKEGFAEATVSITADDIEQVQTLNSLLRIAGIVTDAETGRPIEQFAIVPVIEFSSSFFSVDRDKAKQHSGGQYAVELERSDVAHRVRIEAGGYRTAMSATYRVGDTNPTCDFRLQPAPPARGHVVDEGGNPVTGAKVFLATKSQGLDIDRHKDDSHSIDNDRRITDERGEFVFPAQFERYTVVVIHDEGYAEVPLAAEELPGELTLKKWARVEGRLLQAGEPVALASVWLWPLRPRFDDLPYIDDRFFAETDEAGRFVFPRVPPVKCFLKADLSPWQDFPITSSQSVPLDLQPGQQLTVDLGGKGGQIIGRVVLKGESAHEIDLNWSLNYLLRKAPGIEPPADVAAKGFDWRRGWSDAWTNTSEGKAYLSTLHHHFVKLNRDGTFHISGVSAGDYELAFKIYERPEGCLVNPVGAKAVRFRVTETVVASDALDLGRIEIEAALGPKPGQMVPDFEFETLDGGRRKLSGLRGRYVLLDFWATWCGPCVAAVPAMRELHDTYRADGRLVVLSVSVDADKNAASQFVKRHKLSWMQGFVGDVPDSRVLTSLGISSVPMYVLIAPDGMLVVKTYAADELKDKIDAVLRQ